MRTAIKDVRFMRLYTNQLGYMWKCVVYYASGRVVEYKERVPAPVARYLREVKIFPVDDWTLDLLADWGVI